MAAIGILGNRCGGVLLSHSDLIHFPQFADAMLGLGKHIDVNIHTTMTGIERLLDDV